MVQVQGNMIISPMRAGSTMRGRAENASHDDIIRAGEGDQRVKRREGAPVIIMNLQIFR